MSFAAYKMMHWPTGIENCASGFVTHSRADYSPQIPPIQPDADLDSDFPSAPRHDTGPIPNLVVTAANVLEVYKVRVQPEGGSGTTNGRDSKGSRGGVMDGVAGASLELVCHYR